MKPPIIFLSYSHKDERDKDRLVTQIKVLERAGKIDLWNDDRIRAGGAWKHMIDEAMTKAKVAILLVTANFLTSNFILDVEVPELLERHKVGGLDIIPVIARDCAWEVVTWLSKMNVRPKNGEPIWRSGGRYVEKELTKIAREVASIIKEKELYETTSNSPEPAIATIRSNQKKNIENAIQAINTELEQIVQPGALVDVFTIEKIIHTSISYGVSLYNKGRIKDCADIYSHTVKGVINSLEISGYSSILSKMHSMPSPQALPDSEFEEFIDNRDVGVEISYSILKEFSSLQATTVRNAMKVAWRIRHGFDQIRFMSSGMKAVDVGLRSFGTPGESFSLSVERVVKLAISQSGLTYEEGLSRRQNWIKACAAIYLYTAQAMSSMLPMTELPRGKHSRESADKLEIALENLMLDEQFITGKNAYEIAWNIRHSFEQALS